VKEWRADQASKTKELAQLVTDSRTFMSQIAKAKTAKLSKLLLVRLRYGTMS
jgi:hypothetical protein